MILGVRLGLRLGCVSSRGAWVAGGAHTQGWGWGSAPALAPGVLNQRDWSSNGGQRRRGISMQASPQDGGGWASDLTWEKPGGGSRQKPCTLGQPPPKDTLQVSDLLVAPPQGRGRNAAKRVAKNARNYGLELIQMGPKEVAKVVRYAELAEETSEAVALAKSLTRRGKNGWRRQVIYIGSLLRDVSPAVMEAAIRAAKYGTEFVPVQEGPRRE